MSQNGPITPDAWMADVFRAKAARDGCIIRRRLRDIDRYVGRAAFISELERRGYQAVENAGQLVIFCNREPLRRVL
ncbi:N-(5'-phosphoribosyl)anthranilate isomerase [Roseovarius sp.]|uniref:N-(5'-phosphoribosyl)anthranilate isomerase n=1 Tax=Roseovarius sp. TaxID=1486281 RepID=UPI003B5C26D3